MKGDFLDFTKEHKLSEEECELVTFYRTLDKERQRLLLRTAYYLVESAVENNEG